MASGVPKADVDPVTGRIQETPELREKGLAALRVLIEKEKASGFKFVREDDAFLVAFCRCKKYDMDKVITAVKNFSIFWYQNPGIVNGNCAERVRKVYELDFMRFLPGTDVHGNMVQMMHMGRLDYSKFTPADLARLSLYTICKVFEDEEMQFQGVTYVETMEGFSVLKAMSTSNSLKDPDQQKIMNMGLDTFPMRIRDIYLVHQPTWFSWFWGLVKYFFRKKLRDRLHLLGTNFEELYKVVPREHLPPEFGGTFSGNPSFLLDELEAKEKATGMLGGFAIPMRQDDPTGEKRRAEAEAAKAAAAEAAPAADAAAAASGAVDGEPDSSI